MVKTQQYGFEHQQNVVGNFVESWREDMRLEAARMLDFNTKAERKQFPVPVNMTK